MRMWVMKYIGPRTQKVLWICLLGLTVAIILWPVAPSVNDPLPMQSIYAIKNLPWFIVVFMGWVLNLAALLFFARGSVWDRLALCLVFIVVFVQFWGFKAAPWGNSIDSSWLMGHVNYLEHTAKIPATGHPTLKYFDFPALTLIGLAIKQVSGADLFLAIRIYLTLSGLFITAILYAAFLKLLRTPYLAALGVVLALACGAVLGPISNIFHPANLATIYIVTFFLLLARGTERFSEQNTTIIFLLLVVASTIEYIFTPVFFSMILLANYIFHRMAKSPGNITLTTAILPLALSLSWNIYWTGWVFRSSVVGFPLAFQAILTGKWLVPTGMILRENVGTTYPWWGNATKLFWWLSVFGFGTLLMLWRLLRWRQADSSRRTEIACFTGVLATILIGSVAAGAPSVVHGGLSRYIWVAPIVLVPAMIGFLANLRRRYLAIVFTAVGLLLLLPTFLTNADNISADRVYRNEMATFEFINSSHTEGEELTLYFFPFGVAVGYVYEPDARVITGAYLYGGASETEAWQALQREANEFLARMYVPNLAIISIKGKVEYKRYLLIPLDHPNWRNLELQLSAGNRVYDNGSLQMYKPQ